MADTKPVDTLRTKDATELALTDYLIGHDDGSPAAFRTPLGEALDFLAPELIPRIVRSGEFTPTIVTTGATPSVSFSDRAGRYLRIGPLVLVSIRATIASITGGSGNLRVGGLPFTARNDDMQRTRLDVAFSNSSTTWPSGGTQAFALAMAGEARVGLYASGPSVGILNFTPANLVAGTSVYLSGFYWTDDP